MFFCISGNTKHQQFNSQHSNSKWSFFISRNTSISPRKAFLKYWNGIPQSCDQSYLLTMIRFCFELCIVFSSVLQNYGFIRYSYIISVTTLAFKITLEKQGSVWKLVVYQAFSRPLKYRVLSVLLSSEISCLDRGTFLVLCILFQDKFANFEKFLAETNQILYQMPNYIGMGINSMRRFVLCLTVI